MAKCINCGAEVTDKMKFCSECGTRVPGDQECPACHARCPIAAKFCSECGCDLSKPPEGTASDANAETFDEEDSPSGDGNHASRTCSILLKDAGADINAVIREVRALLNKTFADAKELVKNAPTPLHLDCPREEAERIASTLEGVGATVEIFNKDVGTVTSGNCSVVLNEIPSKLGPVDKAVISAEVAQLMGCMPANAWKMLDDLPLTIAENISREEAEEIVSTFKSKKCSVEIV